MKNITTILASIVSKLKNTDINLKRMNAQDIDDLKTFLNEQPYNLWVDDHSTLSPYFVNNRAKVFYGFKENDISKLGFNLYKEILHPETFTGLKTTFASFNKDGTKTHVQVASVKVKGGDYAWVFLAANPICHDSTGKAKYILSVIFNIDELVGLAVNNNHNGKDTSFIISNKDLYQSLTNREKEILRHISNGTKNKDIAQLLDISTETVKTHRKTILRKLNVKSAIELVKFAINFD